MLRKNMVSRGLLIVFEGIDGSGKATQIESAVTLLKEKKREFSLLAYPDINGEYGEEISAFLNGKKEISVREQFALFLKDIEKDQEKIRELLEKGAIVILDRYVYSTLAYQCSKGFDIDEAKEIVELKGFITPDLVILADIRPKTAVERKRRQKGKGDVHEADEGLLGRVRAEYNELFEEKWLAAKWVKIDAEKPVEEVKEKVKGLISDLLK